MSSELENQKNAIISIVGTVIFSVLTILVPLLKVLGGFLIYSETSELFGQQITTKVDYFWDQITGSVMGLSLNLTYDQLVQQGDSAVELIWQIIPIWGLIWIVLGVIGAILVGITAFQKLQGQKQIGVAKIGLVIGLVATLGEYGLFFLALALEKWDSTTPNINIILLGCFVIGWVGLILGYVYATKN
ncbi:MAG: hypothetical protein ACTSPV_19155 [Candidatus Hodarchaeales archaeon]